ncbi:MAG TPA: hypothetical protein VFD66_00950, partial [Verrucomicrobiae bacterium]|nr:hypothetical protein [Verrucomicrobiae bacterium]
MERKTQKYGLINVLALLAVGIAGFAVARAASSLAGLVSAVYLGIGMLVAGMGWFHARLEENEQLEKLEFDELIKSKSSSALFENRDAASFQAQHSREQFERYFIPVLTSLLCLGQGFAAIILWRWISAHGAGVEVRQPVVALALFGLFFLMLFILGRFSSVLARLQDHRLLRPGASWVLLSAYLCLAVALGLVGVWSGLPRMDFYVARVLCALLGLMAFETLVGLLLEMYRPRLKGKVGRPLYDSRLVGLLGQPEGLITTAAQAL